MKTNDEIRAIALQRLFKGGWFWRLLGGGILLGVCVQIVQTVIGAICRGLEGRGACPQAPVGLEGLLRAGGWDNRPYLLSLFLGVIMAGIVTYGMSKLFLRAERDEEQDWLKSAFDGFSRPLGLAGLYCLMCAIYLVWLALGLVPVAIIAFFRGVPIADSVVMASLIALFRGMPVTDPVALISMIDPVPLVALVALAIPFYRYRFLFYVKVDHPDWSAFKCLAECRRIMKGNMLRSFKLDCSYWKIILVATALWLFSILAVVLIAAFGVSGLALGLVALLSSIGMIACVAVSIVLGFYIGLGQTILYREISVTAAGS